jgi:hypothetical protein
MKPTFDPNDDGQLSNVAPVNKPVDEEVAIEMIVCSFALHLVKTPSELFTLLWELSTKARWFILLAPHKKPEVAPSCLSLLFRALILVRSRMAGDGSNGMWSPGKHVE